MAVKDISLSELKQIYHKDFPLWVDINLQLLKEKAYELVDWENLLEEIEDMGQRHLDACISYLAVILEHMYKWDNFKHLAGGEDAGSKWIKSIKNARTGIEAEFKKYPSIKSKLPLQFEKAWIEAIKRIEIWLRNNDYEPEDFDIPEECPYTYQQAMERNIKIEMK